MGAAFLVMATLLTTLVTDRLFEQRTHQDSLSVEKLAVMCAPFFASADLSPLQETLPVTAGEMGGRILLTDETGKVQLDTANRLYGQRLQLPEVLEVLDGSDSLAYGIHHTDESPSGDYASYCAARMMHQGQTVGTVVYVAPVQSLVDAVSSLQAQMWRIFAIVTLSAIVISLVFSRLISHPLQRLTRTIKRMERGDLSARVKVRGSGEMRELAENYNRMAEKIEHFDKSRSQFVSNASHELKTPLTTMKILLESLIYQPDMPAEMREEFMQDINHEIDRLNSVVSDLLTLTRADSHETALHVAREDLSELVTSAVHALTPVAEKRRQVLLTDIAPRVQAEVDKSKIGQVITNLVDNALKYTPEQGEIAVSLTVEGKEAVLTVKDNGEGIPEEDLPHIFDRFYRVDKARSRATGGTGLGLSIVRQIITMHQGDITVTSVPGEGSVFTVHLPLQHRKEEVRL